MNQLIFGCGYLGQPVARAWQARGDRVYAITRTSSRAAELRQQGLHPLVGDLAVGLTLPECGHLDTVLFAVGFDRTPGQKLRDVYVEGLRHAIACLPASIERFVYISSTGVYSQDGGEWVDETSVCQPVREGGKACLEAEHMLSASRFADRVIILRLAGLYGPGRLPKLEQLRAGESLAAVEHGFVNLIHVDDAAQTVLAAEKITPPDLIVVSDACPVTRGEFYRELARQVGTPPPQFLPPPNDSSAGQRAMSDKRVGNQRMRERLQVSLRYPTYRQGLTALCRS